jgi:transcriptional regulator with XRE-family HTH domain
MAKGNGGTLWLRRSYSFVDKDPEIDKFRTIYQQEHIKEDDLAALAGISTSTVTNMFGGKTKKPQHATFAKMAAAMGYEYGLQRIGNPSYDKAIQEAKEQRKAYWELQRKRREREEKRGR